MVEHITKFRAMKRETHMKKAGEGIEVETQHVVDRRRKHTTIALDEVGFSVTAVPIEPVNNTTDIIYNVNNITVGNSTNTSNNTDVSINDMILTILGPILLITLYLFGHRANVPSSRYHRGEMIRRQAERVWEIQAAKNERHAIPTETRKSQIDEGLRKMRVLSKCIDTGHCILEPLDDEEQNSASDEDKDDKDEILTATEEEKSAKTEGFEHMVKAVIATSNEAQVASDATSKASEGEKEKPSPISIDGVAAPVKFCTKSCTNCPDSPGTLERKPLLSHDSEDSGDNYNCVELTEEQIQSPPMHTSTACDGFDDDEDVCPICLDNFEVGDVVMFSRHDNESCAHVFHDECLLQWLLKQRENECPTCRACFIAHPNKDSETSSTSSVTTDNLQGSTSGLDEGERLINEESSTSDEGIGDIEEGNGHISSNENIENDDNIGGNCSDDLDVIGERECNSVNENDETGLADTDDTDLERGFTYVIVKGSIQRVAL